MTPIISDLPLRRNLASQFLRHVITPIAQHSPAFIGQAVSIWWLQWLSQAPNLKTFTWPNFLRVSFTSQFWPKLLVDFFALIVDELQDNLLLSPSWLLWVHAELAILNPRNIKSESLSMTHAEIEVHSRCKFYGITESKYS